MAVGTWDAWRSRKTCIIPTSFWWCYPHIDWRAPCWEARERNGPWIPTTVSGKWETCLDPMPEVGRPGETLHLRKRQSPPRGLWVTMVPEGPLTSSAELLCASGRATGSERPASTLLELRLGGALPQPLPVAAAAGRCLGQFLSCHCCLCCTWHTQPPCATSTAAISPAQQAACHNCT